MKISFDELIKHSIVLAATDEKYQVFCKRMLYAELSIPYRYSGDISQLESSLIQKYLQEIRPTYNVNNFKCAINHHRMIEMAKAMNWPYILIFEDDAYPCKDCKKMLIQYFDSAEIPDDCGLLMLGSLEYIQYGSQESYMSKVSTCGIAGAHAYVVFQKYYDLWLQTWKNDTEYCPADKFFRLMCANAYLVNKSFFLQVGINGSIDYFYMIRDKQHILSRFGK